MSHASEIIGRDVRAPTLAVDAKGRAGVTYRTADGEVKHVLVWGAVDARHPQRGTEQVKFEIDYAGGYGTFRENLVQAMVNTCTRVEPTLPWLLLACRARDGSFWALQSWQRMLPNLGVLPWEAERNVWELHISHWTGDVAEFEVRADWVYSRRFHQLFGRLRYRGRPVFGFDSSRQGEPLDGFGRNIYLDTLDSAYGSGWRRENSFLTNTRTGVVCYGFYPHDPYPGYPDTVGRRSRGHGTRYRLTVIGPGVTPDVAAELKGLPDYVETSVRMIRIEREMNALRKSWKDRQCRKD